MTFEEAKDKLQKIDGRAAQLEKGHDYILVLDKKLVAREVAFHIINALQQAGLGVLVIYAADAEKAVRLLEVEKSAIVMPGEPS